MMLRKVIIRFSVVGVALCLASLVSHAAEQSPKLSVQNPWVRPAPRTLTSALYLTLQNAGATPDALVGVSSEVARAVELHESRMEGAIMRMVPVSRIPIPAQGATMLKPGGFHVMLIALQRDVQPGDTVTVQLHFEKSDVMTVTVPVRQPERCARQCRRNEWDTDASSLAQSLPARQSLQRGKQ